MVVFDGHWVALAPADGDRRSVDEADPETNKATATASALGWPENQLEHCPDDSVEKAGQGWR